MTDNPVILITRPEPQASRFADELRQQVGSGAVVLVSPILQSRFFGEPIDGDAFAAAVFTSETGVTGAARLWTGRKGFAFAVGNRTAEAASALGWLCDSADGTGADLAQHIAASGMSGPMVWPKGRHGGKSLLEAAEVLGLKIVPRVVYEQEPVEMLAGKLEATAGRRLILPLFSPRSARIARERLGALSGIETVAISEAAAEAWGEPATCVAAHPSGTAMIEAIVGILHQATT